MTGDRAAVLGSRRLPFRDERQLGAGAVLALCVAAFLGFSSAGRCLGWAKPASVFSRDLGLLQGPNSSRMESLSGATMSRPLPSFHPSVTRKYLLPERWSR